MQKLVGVCCYYGIVFVLISLFMRISGLWEIPNYDMHSKKLQIYFILVFYCLFEYFVSMKLNKKSLCIRLKMLNMCSKRCLSQRVALDYQSIRVPMQHLHRQPDDFLCIRCPMQQYHSVRNGFLRVDQLDIPMEHRHHPIRTIRKYEQKLFKSIAANVMGE